MNSNARGLRQGNNTQLKYKYPVRTSAGKLQSGRDGPATVRDKLCASETNTQMTWNGRNIENSFHVCAEINYVFAFWVRCSNGWEWAPDVSLRAMLVPDAWKIWNICHAGNSKYEFFRMFLGLAKHNHMRVSYKSILKMKTKSFRLHMEWTWASAKRTNDWEFWFKEYF